MHWSCCSLLYRYAKNHNEFSRVKTPRSCNPLLSPLCGGKRRLWDMAWTLCWMCFPICNGIVTDMANSMGGISEAMVSLPAEMQTAIENVGFLASIPLWLVTILGSLFITVLSFVMILTVYGRFFRLYMYTALAPLPLAAFAGVKHTIRGHIIFEKLCRRVLRGCGHCAGLRDLLGVCQYADSSQRWGHYHRVELPCRNRVQYARTCGADKRLWPNYPWNDGVVICKFR